MENKHIGNLSQKLKRAAQAGVLATATLLHPEAAHSQTQDKDKQKIEQKEQEQTIKYQQWLIDMSTENPKLVGAKILNNRALANQGTYLISSQHGGVFIYHKAGDTQADFTLQSFKDAVEAGFARKTELENQEIESREKLVRVTEPEKKQWLAELIASEPELKGSSILLVGRKPSKKGDTDGVSFYSILFNKGVNVMCEIEISDSWNTKEEFFAKVKSFLRGDTYQSEIPGGVTADFSKGAAKVMGMTGINISNGVITFHKGGSGENTFSLADAKKVRFFNPNSNRLQMAVTRENGETWVFPIRNGQFFPNEKKKLVTK